MLRVESWVYAGKRYLRVLFFYSVTVLKYQYEPNEAVFFKKFLCPFVADNDSTFMIFTSFLSAINCQNLLIVINGEGFFVAGAKKKFWYDFN